MYRQCTSEKAAAQQRKFEAALQEMLRYGNHIIVEKKIFAPFY